VRKLLSIGIVVALLVTFVVPVVVAAQDQTYEEWMEECCGYTPPECAPLPDRNTKTLAGAAVWTMLGTMDTMGMAVCTVTGLMACNLGGWSDELGVVAVDISGAALEGIAGLLEIAIGTFLPDYEELGKGLGDLLRAIAGALGATA
jgi:hypothetical protein